MAVCPKCDQDIAGGTKFCPECGAPLSDTGGADKRLNADKRREADKSPALDRRILIGLLGILAFALCAIVLLLLNDYAPAESAIEARASIYSPTPSPSPTPVPSNEAAFFGAWKAIRTETNRNKTKPYIPVGTGAGVIVAFKEDGTITGIASRTDGPDIVQRFDYFAEGDSIYDDVGPEYIDGAQYYSRVRYFFKNPDELRCVYLLDGRESSDFILFMRLADYIVPEPNSSPETPADEADSSASPSAPDAPTPPPSTSAATARPVEY